MTDLLTLVRIAKDAFDLSAAIGAYKPEGIAIRMKSGIVLTGYGQNHQNAARDAMRVITPNIPRDEVEPHIMDHFTIMAVAFVTSARNAAVSIPVMDVLLRHPALDKNAIVYATSPKKAMLAIPDIMKCIELRNELNT